MQPAHRFQSSPGVIVRHKRELEAVEQAIALWQQTHPQDVANWKAAVRVQADLFAGTGGWSRTKEMLAGAYWPFFVTAHVGRNLRRLGWSWEESQRWDRTADGRDDSDLFKHAVRTLLPDSQPWRKEQRLRSHHGWSPA